MIDDLLSKTKLLLERQNLNENEVLSLMILIRKQLELMNETERGQYLVLNLFCNWVAHTKIDQSITGLRILARINNVLVQFAKADTNRLRLEISGAIGFEMLRTELLALFCSVDISNQFATEAGWSAFLAHLIEIIRDVPIAFQPIGKLKAPAREIYDNIAHRPIKSGAGVIQITLSNIDYDALGATGIGVKLCLVVLLEDSTTIVSPLVVGSLAGLTHI